MVRSRRTPTTVFCHFSEARAVTAPAETLISPKLLTARAVLLAALGHALGEGGKRDHPAPRPQTEFHALIRRSEEHTSELQSLMRISYAVFCLKKKKKHNNTLILLTHNNNTTL